MTRDPARNRYFIVTLMKDLSNDELDEQKQSPQFLSSKLNSFPV
jgi:hypothetical protein